MTVKIVEVDTGWNDLISGFRAAQGAGELFVGILSPGKGHPSGTSVGAVAAAHEFGTSRNPAQNFLRGTFDKNIGSYVTRMGDLMSRSLGRRGRKIGVRSAMLSLGPLMVKDIRQEISAIPLIETRTLLKAVGFVVQK
jgi:hypothetical protein